MMKYWSLQHPLWVSVILRKSTVLIRHIEMRCRFFLVFLLVLWVHFACMKAIPHFNLADINSIRWGCCANQNCASLFNMMVSTYQYTLLCRSIMYIPTFTSAFNIVWKKPYHSTRVLMTVFCKFWTNSLINFNFMQADERPSRELLIDILQYSP